MSPFPKVEPRKERDEHYENGDRSETHLASSRGELDRMTSTITPQRPGNTNLTCGPRNPAQTRDTGSRLSTGRKIVFARQRRRARELTPAQSAASGPRRRSGSARVCTPDRPVGLSTPLSAVVAHGPDR